MDKQTYIQLDRIENKLDTLIKLEGIEIDQQGNPILNEEILNEIQEEIEQENEGRIQKKKITE